MEGVNKDIRAIALANAASHGSTTSKIVLAKLLGTRPDLRKDAKNLIPIINDIVEQVNGMGKKELERFRPAPTLKRAENELPPLPGAIQGGVITRFPPEPSGYPHIGHAKAAIINYQYAMMYGGKIILRMDDTNPAAERLEYYAAIKVGLEWLGIDFDHIKNTSDDMDTLHQKAAELIHIGRAYVCTCNREDISANRRSKISCKCSKLGAEENHSRWARMQTKYKPGTAILRYRGDMGSPNTTMRDPVLFRITDEKHPLLGNQYRTWPSYDLAIAVEDSLDGVTHAFRSKEYEMRDQLYHSIQESLGLRQPYIGSFSRLALQDMPVSKRLIRPLLERGHMASYDDPRLPTLEGLKRRGIQPEAIRRFVRSLGFTKSDTTAPFQTLESNNRSVIDSGSVRLHLVRDPVTLATSDMPGPVQLPALSGSGDKPRSLDATGGIILEKADALLLDSGAIHLMGLGAATWDGTTVSYVPNVPDAPRVHWVPADSAISIIVLVPGPPFKGEEFDENSMPRLDCMVEPYYDYLPDYSMMQFVRFGYARKESARQAVFSHK